MTAGSAAPLPPDVERQLESLAPARVAVAVPTYNNASTIAKIVEAIRAGLEKHFEGVPAVLINSDAGSSDGTPERLAEAALPLVHAIHPAPPGQLATVPFHGVPGRGASIELSCGIARRLGARALVVLEADAVSIDDEWLDGLARPVLEHGADLVLPVHARHRYDGTMTNLVLSPLVGALFGRRLHQPFAGARAMSARLLDRLAEAPWPPPGRGETDLWLTGTAIAEDFAVREARLGPWRVESNTRVTDLPTMAAQTLGAVFTLMDGYDDLWRRPGAGVPTPTDVRAGGGREAGAAPSPPGDRGRIDPERMLGAFRRGLSDLGTIWEQVLAPETWGDVLSLETEDPARFRFPDDLWARAVYDFAVGHHHHVVYHDHLLRSFVPLYLGRTAAFVLTTRARDAAAAETALDATAAAFEEQKPYLVDRW
jgi:glycosyltransferase involved in cell wall biosynthesis